MGGTLLQIRIQVMQPVQQVTVLFDMSSNQGGVVGFGVGRTTSWKRGKTENRV